ncbi:hypothetical protein F5141DRAFT_1209689 [Pisolithus sp. B1]|nr:hypothetical protein F5141DRAFT_1209689 [Pisolithus sp. B1]
MEWLSLTKQEVMKHAIEAYGSVEHTMKAMEIAEAENNAAIERVCPNGYTALQVGCMPKPGEEVTFLQLQDDPIVQVIWGGDLESYQCYCFDFVNRECQYILTPDDVKIYTMATAFSPSIQVLSMEDSLEKVKVKLLYSHATRCDPNWETYVIHEGTILHITQQNHPDHFLHIPI